MGKKTRKNPPVSKKEVAEKIKRLRKALANPGDPPRPQEALAKMLEVGRSQIAAWESEDSKDYPSTDNFIKLGDLAKTSEERAFFYAGAGIPIDALRTELRREEKSRQRKASPMTATAVSLIKSFKKDPLGISLVDAGVVEMPSWLFGDSAQIFALEIDHASGILGLPAPLCVGDLVFIDQSFATAEDFQILEMTAREPFFAALLIPHLPEHLERRTPRETLKEMRRMVKAGESGLAPFVGPAVLYGKIYVRAADPVAVEDPLRAHGASASRTRAAATPWQLVFDAGSRVFALSNWGTDFAAVLGSDLSRGPFFDDARILGAVVSWSAGLRRLRGASPDAPEEEWVPAIPTPDCECGRKCECVCHGSRKADGSREKGRKRRGELEHTEPCCGEGSRAHAELCEKRQSPR